MPFRVTLDLPSPSQPIAFPGSSTIGRLDRRLMPLDIPIATVRGHGVRDTRSAWWAMI
jgi:hypothetical protein